MIIAIIVTRIIFYYRTQKAKKLADLTVTA